MQLDIPSQQSKSRRYAGRYADRPLRDRVRKVLFLLPYLLDGVDDLVLKEDRLPGLAEGLLDLLFPPPLLAPFPLLPPLRRLPLAATASE